MTIAAADKTPIANLRPYKNFSRKNNIISVEALETVTAVCMCVCVNIHK